MASPSRFSSASLRLVVAAALLGGHAFAQAPTAPKPAPPAAQKPKPKPTPPPVLDKNGVKLIPQPGVEIAGGDRAELEAGVTALGKDLTVLKHNLKSKPELAALLPDVMIFHKAVDWALRYNEFFNVKQVATAKELLELGNQRAAELKEGQHSWTTATGLVVRGYLSKIDGSVQPYGMVIPEDWKPGETTGRRLDFWCHGRGETLSELAFIDDRLTKPGEYQPSGAFVLHLYGRYCCANKFAGEVDLFEALASAKKTYNIDPNKLVVRGFSMGGAAVWQFGTHFAGMWAVVQPGAGFAETREFNKVYAEGKTMPTWWEEVLYRWYDSTDYVANLSNTTTVAYSGEIDGQKQAADIMIRYARKDAGNASPPAAVLGKVEPGDGSPSAAEARVTGTAPDVEFYHVIALQIPHKVVEPAKTEVEKLVAAAVAKHEAAPKKVRFVTYSLIYPEMEWVIVSAMEKQWERAEVDATITNDGSVEVKTKNVSSLVLRQSPKKRFIIDGIPLIGDPNPPTNYPAATFHKENGKWVAGSSHTRLANKTPTVCGPVDHAFMSSFVFVKPTGQPLNAKVGAWAAGELDHAVGFWRKVFRGEAPVKDDTAITEDDIQNSNLVLWGDPSSNAVLKKIADKLPLQWDAKNLVFGGQTYDATHVAPVLIFPNPLNPAKYIVLNSGPTFREDALLNNSQQIPKLPDWAFIDVNTPPDAKWPGLVLDAGFFDEQWQVPGK